MARIRCEWSGGGITGPGVSTFYADPASVTCTGDLLTFWASVGTSMPSSVLCTIPSTGDLVDEATGSITGVWAIPGGGLAAGTRNLAFALGVGARVEWTTAGIHGGRHVRGRTFLVPLVGASFDTDGSLFPATSAALLTAAGNLVLTHPGQFYVWSRPKAGLAGAKTPFLGAVIPDTPATLRSRRT